MRHESAADRQRAITTESKSRRRAAAAAIRRLPAAARGILPALALSAAVLAGPGAMPAHAQDDQMCVATPGGDNGNMLCLDFPDDLVLTAGVAPPGGVIRLPEATGGSPGYAYTLSPDPPAGMNFFGSPEPQIEETPTAAQEETEYTLTVRDLDGAMVSVTFNITVAGGTPSLDFLSGDDPATRFRLAEHEPVGTEVGAPLVAANFPDGDPTWAITAGNTGNVFAIDSATGQLRTAALLDFETTPSYDLTIRLTQGGAMAQLDVTVTVTDINELPVTVGTIPPVSVRVDGAAVGVDVAANFDDDDGDTLTYGATSGDTAIATVSVAGSVVSITPVAVGATTVTVTARDQSATPATQDIAVTVTAAGATGATVGFAANTGGEVNEGGEIRFRVDLSEAQSEAIVVSFTVAGSGTNPATASTDLDVGLPQNSVTIAANSTARTFRIRAVEDTDPEEDETFTVTLTGVTGSTDVTLGSATTATGTILDDDTGNNAPVAVGMIDAVTLTVGGANALRDVEDNFSDPDGDTLFYDVTRSNEDVAFVVEFLSVMEIEPLAAGSVTVTVTARDLGGLTATQTIAVTVNDPPTVTATGTYSVAEDASSGDNVGAALTASDFPAGTGTWSITAGNTGDAFSIGTDGQLQVAGSLDHETTPSYTLTVRFERGGTVATAEVTVTVTDVNEAPVASGAVLAVSPVAGGSAATVDVAGSFSDPDGDTLTYSATSDDAAVATVTVSGSTVTVTPVAEGTATVTVTAADPAGLRATATILVTVRAAGSDPDANVAPPAPVVADRDAGIGAMFTYTFGAVIDPNGDTVTYAAARSDGSALPGWLSFAAATRTFSGTPQDADAGTVTVRVTVTDDHTSPLSSTADFTISVAEPLLTASGPYRVAEDAAVGTPVGAPIVARYFPPGTGMWAIAAAGNIGGAFSISDGGQIAVAAPLDRETTPSYSLMVEFSQGGTILPLPLTVEVVESLAVPGARADRVSAAVLPRVAQAVATGALSAISGRIDAAVSGAAPSPVPGLAGRTHVLQALKAGEGGLKDGTTDLARALGGSSFVMSLGAAGDGAVGAGDIAVWGAGDYRRLSGPDGGMVDWDGNMAAFHLGADVRMRPDLLAGVSISRSRGDFDYTDRGGPEPVSGTYDSRMNAVHPYVGWTPAGGPRLWATAGYGRGDVDISEEAAPGGGSDTEMVSAAAGGSHVLLSRDGLPGGTATLRLKGEGSVARIEVDGGEGIRPAEFDMRRLRAALAGGFECLGSPGGCLAPSLEVGVRHDGGDARGGAGVEVGGSLRWTDAGSGLTVEGRGRALVLDGDGYGDWGVGGLIRLDAGADGRGLSFRMVPGFGDATGRAGGLYDRESIALTGDSGELPAGRLETELGYGFAGVVGTVTPYAGFSLADEGARDWRTGVRLDVGTAFGVDLEGTRRVRTATDPDHAITARGRLSW